LSRRRKIKSKRTNLVIPRKIRNLSCHSSFRLNKNKGRTSSFFGETCANMGSKKISCCPHNFSPPMTLFVRGRNIDYNIDFTVICKWGTFFPTTKEYKEQREGSIDVEKHEITRERGRKSLPNRVEASCVTKDVFFTQQGRSTQLKSIQYQN